MQLAHRVKPSKSDLADLKLFVERHNSELKPLLRVTSSDGDDGGRTALMLWIRASELPFVTFLAPFGELEARDAAGNLTALHTAAFAHQLDCIKVLVKAGSVVDAPTGNSGATALAISAAEGQHEAVAFLLEKGADPTLSDKKGAYVLEYAIESLDSSTVEKVMNAMLKKSSFKVADARWTDITDKAIKTRNPGIAEILLEKGMRPSAAGVKIGNNNAVMAALLKRYPTPAK